jgi:hypothetical protein
MLSPTLRKDLLRTLVTRTLRCGLARGIVEDALVEVADPAYERQPVTFGEPYEDGIVVAVDNDDDVLFAAWATDSDYEVTHWFMVDEQGTLLAAGECKRILSPQRGDSIRFWPGDLTVGLEDPTTLRIGG